MADLSNLQISESFQRVLQRDPTTGFLQDLVGAIPSNIIFNGTTLRYIDGNQQSGYVLTSDANGNASWAVAGGGGVDVYWSANTDGSISTSGDSNVQLNGTLTVGVNDTGHDVRFFGATAGKNMLWDESDDALELTDNTRLKFGAGDDLQIYSDGTNGRISVGSGLLQVQGDTLDFTDGGATSYLFRGVAAGPVSLYHSGNRKLDTAGDGVHVEGLLSATSSVVTTTYSFPTATLLSQASDANVRLGYDSSLDTFDYGKDPNVKHYFYGTSLTSQGAILSSGKTFIGSIDNAGASYGEDKILVAQGDGEVEYLGRTDLKNYLSITDYFTASTANGNAIVNSGMTTSKVGIGTTIPNHTLSVSGTVSASSNVHIQGDLGISANTYFNDSSSVNDGRLNFGNSQDLAIYHDGSDSYIQESGTGRLHLKGGGGIDVVSPADESMAIFNANSSVDLYFNNSLKINTTTDGAHVTGTLSASSSVITSSYAFPTALLLSQGNAANVRLGYDASLETFEYGKDSDVTHTFYGTSLTSQGAVISSGKTFIGQIDAAGGGYTTDKILVAQGDGEVEYLTTEELKEDIGISEYWSASTANANAIVNSGMTTSKVGIGTTIPNHELSVSGTISATSSIYGFQIEIGDDRYIGSASDSDAIQIKGNGTVSLTQSLTLEDGKYIYFGNGLDGQIFVDSDDLYIQNVTSDKDIIFRGNDNGGTVTALKLDMSDAGTAVFGNEIQLADNNAIKFGLSDDGKIFEESTHLVIQSTQSDSDILFHGNDNGSVVNAARLEMATTSLTVKGNIILSGGSSKGNFAIGGAQGLEDSIFLTPMDFYSTNLNIASGGRSGAGYIRNPGYMQSTTASQPQYASYVVPYGYRISRAACYADAGTCTVYSGSPLSPLSVTVSLSPIAVQDTPTDCDNFTTLDTYVDSDGCGSYVVVAWTPAGAGNALFGAGLIIEST